MSTSKEGVTGAETHPLNLRWTFGFNSQIPGGAISLVTPERNAIFYAAAHTGVILDTTTDKQSLLQGHCNPITAACVSQDKKWIVTADCGEESMIVVWDAVKACPAKIIPSPFPTGVCALDVSSDGMFIVALSHAFPRQEVAVWEWSAPTTEPAVKGVVEGAEFQHCVRLNPVDVRDIVTNGLTKAIFWTWTDNRLAALPPKAPRGAAKRLGVMTQTAFLPYNTKAVTATSGGFLVLWDYPVSELVQSTGRDAIKVLNLCPHAGINIVTTLLDRYLVCGCQDGAVRVFDFQFRIVAWFEDLNAGAIVATSFADKATVPALAMAGAGGKPGAASGAAVNEFLVPELLVATSQGKIVRLDTQELDITGDADSAGRKGRLVVQGFDGDVVAIDTHPSLPVFAVGTSAGTLQLWDLEDRELLASRNLAGASLNPAPGTASAATAAAGSSATSAAAQVMQEAAAAAAAASAKAKARAQATKQGKGDLGIGPKPALGTALALPTAQTVTTGAQPQALGDGVNPGSATGPGNATAPGTASPAALVTALKFSPTGRFVVVGTASGAVELVTTLAAAVATGASGANADGSMSPEAAAAAAVAGPTTVEPLQVFQSFNVCQGAVTHVAFSKDELFFAVADAAHYVSMFRYTHRDERPDRPFEWVHLGSAQAHHEDITGLLLAPPIVDLSRTPERVAAIYEHDTQRLKRFWQQHPPKHLLPPPALPNTGVRHSAASAASALAATVSAPGLNAQRAAYALAVAAAAVAPALPARPEPYRAPFPRLLSLGKDRRLVEYDVPRASVKDGLRVATVAHADQTDGATAMLFLPGSVAPANEFRRNAGAKAAGKTGVAAGPGGTYPPPAVLAQSDPSDILVQCDSLLVATEGYKLKLYLAQAAQPPAGPAMVLPGVGGGAASSSLVPMTPAPPTAGGPVTPFTPASPARAHRAATSNGSAGEVGTTMRGFNFSTAPAAPSVATTAFSSVNSTPFGPGIPTHALCRPTEQAAAVNPTGTQPFWWAPLICNDTALDPSASAAAAAAREAAAAANDTNGDVSAATALAASAAAAAAAAAVAASSSAAAASSAVRALVSDAQSANIDDKRQAEAAQQCPVAPMSAFAPLVCRKVTLAPRYAGPVTRLAALPAAGAARGKSDCDYLVYACADKVVGLIKLPLTGDPERSMALLAHPGAITGMTTTHDSRFLLTAGGKDRCVNLWALNPASFDASIALAGPSLETFLSLLAEGPCPGAGAAGGAGDGTLTPEAVHEEIVDYFYHGELRDQGLHKAGERQVKGKIPVSEAVSLMRVLGYFPSEDEVRTLHHEVAWDHYAATAADAPTTMRTLPLASVAHAREESVTLEETIRLLANYRPVFALQASKVDEALATISNYVKRHAARSADSDDEVDDEDDDANALGDGTVSREALVHLLAGTGEPLGEKELRALLHVIQNKGATPGSAIGVQTATAGANGRRGAGGHGLFGKNKGKPAAAGSAAAAGATTGGMKPTVDAYLPATVSAEYLLNDVLKLDSVLAQSTAAAMGYAGATWSDK